jgi:hypothetical protein
MYAILPVYCEILAKRITLALWEMHVIRSLRGPAIIFSIPASMEGKEAAKPVFAMLIPRAL